jgi:hypothetical protein
MRLLTFLASALLLMAQSWVRAQPSADLPYDGVAQGHTVVVPVSIPASTSLAGFQCDMLYSTNLLCTGAVTFVEGTPNTVVDGAEIKPGTFRLLAYAPSGSVLSNGVVCQISFTARTNATSGQVPLRLSTNYFGNDYAKAITGTVNPGLILVGDAFGFVPGGGRAQLRATTGSNYVMSGSTNAKTWTPLVTNTAADGLVFTLDTDVSGLSRRFYRIVPTP